MKAIIFIVVFALSTFGTVNSARYALLVGQNNGGKKLTRLKYAHNDASRFSDLLVEIGGFDKSNVVVVLGADSSDLESGKNSIVEIRFTLSPESCVWKYTGTFEITCRVSRCQMVLEDNGSPRENGAVEDELR